MASSAVDEASTITFDLYNLAAFNYDPVRLPEEDVEGHMLQLATTNTQELLKRSK